MMLPAALIARIRGAAIQQGVFTLPSGEVLDEYFDQYLLASDPVLLREVANAMAREIPRNIEVVAGVALGGVPLTVALSAATGVRAGFIRHEPKTYGTRRQIEAAVVAGSRVVVVDDVVRTGSQILRATEALRRVGATVSMAICVLDRDLGGRDQLAENGIELRSLLTPSILFGVDSSRCAG